ncbi:MAG TPA: GGDEF domain-containing protein [Tepidisphaeraceae bacterium]|nr:GGDEF domain-containing protein [Tepidisphaeraceae bacterium]
MVRLAHERVLLIGDEDRQVQSALAQAMPAAQIVPVGSVFDAIAELTAAGAGAYTAVAAAAEPIERRPEAAVRALRELTGDGRLLLFGHSTLEPLSRKMLQFGVDDYVVTPAAPGELQQVFGTPSHRVPIPATSAAEALEDRGTVRGNREDGTPAPLPFPTISLADVVLDALLQHPHDAVTAAVRQVNTALGAPYQLRQLKPDAPAPDIGEGRTAITTAVRVGSVAASTLHLSAPADVDESAARHFLAQVAHLLAKIGALQERHNQLQKLAITDELTGLYNGRYFRHFLARITEKAKVMRFPVTLLLFDIDNFKQYNDAHGHAVGDEILKQTAALMKRCVRDHDCVARISGDEFAVVFWDKEGPRQSHSGQGVPGRPPQAPVQVFERFRGLINQAEFQKLGASGEGVLTISGGLAVYPYDAQNPEQLYEAADRALMFGSKKAGKDRVFLVGSDDPIAGPPE